MTRLSIIMEWANTELNSVSRAWDVLQELTEQWRLLQLGAFPDSLAAPERAFLAAMATPAELIIASGQPVPPASLERLRQITAEEFKLSVQVQQGAEYYPLKNLGARASSGDLLLFLDSDVLPDPGWLAALLGSFARPMIQAVAAQTYVAPVDTWSKAFAVGWIYDLPDPSASLLLPRKIHANTLLLKRTDFEEVGGFPAIGLRSRGAGSLIQQRLQAKGIGVWENRGARVRHPPPRDARHLVIRALSQGRDHVFRYGGRWPLSGLLGAWFQATRRMGRSCRRCLNERHGAAIQAKEFPAVLAIITTYYGTCALGALFTVLMPERMARSFRI